MSRAILAGGARAARVISHLTRGKVFPGQCGRSLAGNKKGGRSLPSCSDEAVNDCSNRPKATSNIHVHLNVEPDCWLFHQPNLRAGRASTQGLRWWPPSERKTTAVHVLAPACLPRYVPLQTAPRLILVAAGLHPAGRSSIVEHLDRRRQAQGWRLPHQACPA